MEKINGFMRLPQVLEIIPISKSSLWAGCKSGKYPQPLKLGPRITVWRATDILAFVEKMSGGKNDG